MTELGPNGLPQLSNTAVEATFIFAFVGTGEWPDEDLKSMNTTKIRDDYDGIFADGGGNENDNDEVGGRRGDAQVTRSVVKERPAARREPKVIRLLAGEFIGWWSYQRFDQRVRMRSMVRGAINDESTAILFDTGANISVISERFAKRLRLRSIPNHGWTIDVQGISKASLSTTRRVAVKVTLEQRLAYELEMWVLPHNAGINVILGKDFMIPAGVRLDMHRSTAMLPGVMMLSLLKSQKMGENPLGRRETAGRTTEIMDIGSHECIHYSLQRDRPSTETHQLWVRRTAKLISTLLKNRRGEPARVRLINITDKYVICDAFTAFVVWVPHGDLPRRDDYVSHMSQRHRYWQVLAYNGARDPVLLEQERGNDERWLATQPSPVERPPYSTPTDILRRPSDDSKSTWPRANDRDNESPLNRDDEDATIAACRERPGIDCGAAPHARFRNSDAVCMLDSILCFIQIG